MCGIGGIMREGGKKPSQKIIDKLIKSLRHRGPDGFGRYISNDTALMQTRLAVIDLETGEQPLTLQKRGSAGALALVANGEIYNYIELRLELEERFRTQSDCEPALFLYKKNGLSYAEKLRGMYAIAIHDREKNRLILSRDPFGIKPLYYCYTKSGFVFSSEFQAFIASGLVKPNISKKCEEELLQLQFNSGRETILKGIFRVLPGETIVIEGGKIKENRLLNRFSLSKKKKFDVKTAIKVLDKKLEKSVFLHQRADVPYGLFLSGGVDSSVLLAMMRRLNDKPVNTFTIGFSGGDAHDERSHARKIAQLSGANHEEIDFDENDFWNLLPEIVNFMDEPSADYAILPTFKLASSVKAAGLKVVLSGEGADEIFAGYGRYRRALRPRIFGGRMPRSFGILSDLGIICDDSKEWKQGNSLKRAKSSEITKLQYLQCIDFDDWLPNDLLNKLDRCLMAHGIEGRVPFLDSDLANFAMNLDDFLKIRKRRGKWILREWLDKEMPETRAMSKKRGFTVPVGDWIKSRSKKLAPMIASQEGIRERCNQEKVESLFRNLSGSNKKHNKAAWTLLYYSLWHNNHVLGKSGRGSVFDCLSEN